MIKLGVVANIILKVYEDVFADVDVNDHHVKKGVLWTTYPGITASIQADLHRHIFQTLSK